MKSHSGMESLAAKVNMGKVIFVNNQLDAQFLLLTFIYSTSLHVSSNHVLIISHLYHYYLWYMSLYVGDRVVCRFRWN